MAHQQQQQQLAQSVNCSLDDIDLTSLKVCFKLQEQQKQQLHLMNCLLALVVPPVRCGHVCIHFYYFYIYFRIIVCH